MPGYRLGTSTVGQPTLAAAAFQAALLEASDSASFLGLLLFPLFEIGLAHDLHRGAHLEMAQAAQFPQVFCKLTAVARLSPAPRPSVQHALSVFGPRRLMFGSDWPEGLPDTTWKASLAAFTQAIGAQAIEVREELLGGTAERFYGL